MFKLSNIVTIMSKINTTKIAITAGVVIIALLAWNRFFQTSPAIDYEQKSAEQQAEVETEDSEVIAEERAAEVDITDEDQDLIESESDIEANQDDLDSEQAVLGTAESEEPQFTLFYTTTCPYCHDVLDWIEEESVDDVLNIAAKDVTRDDNYQQELEEAANTCNNRPSVPFLFISEKECIVGSTPIIEHLEVLL